MQTEAKYEVAKGQIFRCVGKVRGRVAYRIDVCVPYGESPWRVCWRWEADTHGYAVASWDCRMVSHPRPLIVPKGLGVNSYGY